MNFSFSKLESSNCMDLIKFSWLNELFIITISKKKYALLILAYKIVEKSDVILTKNIYLIAF